ncbi:MAG: hypothetical protein COB20_06390 [SAR86 cluster bacterium]|uniref:HTH LytTR-type domain-containing protein n=1 Tax=SAR86 cluster bacterium TaxID=2030880 RepID=A0A2A4X7M4_9GAMM|nr:MAG: hypothetical protein COB20_06390 [SAR86 cluster bacterium]
MSQNVAKGHNLAFPSAALLRSALLEPWSVNVGLVLSLTLMFTVSDAFETESLAMLHSITLWAVVSLLMVLQTCLTHRLFLSFFSRTPLSRLFAASLALLATVLLMTVELHFLKFTPLLPKEPDPFFEFVFFVAQPVFAAGCLTLLSQSNAIQKYVDFLQHRRLAGPGRFDDLEELSSILLRHEVLRVSAQDHYLEIVCADQKVLLRGRMKDALSTLALCKGVQIHRSHWVASAHVKEVRRCGRDVRLLLSDGAEVPVARSRSREIIQFYESSV